MEIEKEEVSDVSTPNEKTKLLNTPEVLLPSDFVVQSNNTRITSKEAQDSYLAEGMRHTLSNRFFSINALTFTIASVLAFNASVQLRYMDEYDIAAWIKFFLIAVAGVSSLYSTLVTRFRSCVDELNGFKAHFEKKNKLKLNAEEKEFLRAMHEKLRLASIFPKSANRLVYIPEPVRKKLRDKVLMGVLEFIVNTMGIKSINVIGDDTYSKLYNIWANRFGEAQLGTVELEEKSIDPWIKDKRVLIAYKPSASHQQPRYFDEERTIAVLYYGSHGPLKARLIHSIHRIPRSFGSFALNLIFETGPAFAIWCACNKSCDHLARLIFDRYPNMSNGTFIFLKLILTAIGWWTSSTRMMVNQKMKGRIIRRRIRDVLYRWLYGLSRPGRHWGASLIGFVSVLFPSIPFLILSITNPWLFTEEGIEATLTQLGEIIDMRMGDGWSQASLTIDPATYAGLMNSAAVFTILCTVSVACFTNIEASYQYFEGLAERYFHRFGNRVTYCFNATASDDVFVPPDEVIHWKMTSEIGNVLLYFCSGSGSGTMHWRASHDTFKAHPIATNELPHLKTLISKIAHCKKNQSPYRNINEGRPSLSEDPYTLPRKDYQQLLAALQKFKDRCFPPEKMPHLHSKKAKVMKVLIHIANAIDSGGFAITADFTLLMILRRDWAESLPDWVREDLPPVNVSAIFLLALFWAYKNTQDGFGGTMKFLGQFFSKEKDTTLDDLEAHKKEVVSRSFSRQEFVPVNVNL